MGRVPAGGQACFGNRLITLTGRKREASEPWFTDLKIFGWVFLHAEGSLGMIMATGSS